MQQTHPAALLESNDNPLAAAQRISFLGDISICGELCMAVTLEMLFI